ncbi:MAG: DUF1963 domain-containing protein [Rhodopirellula sp.]|nr:DUF1963 domain-containing protein [Rhodopirellula sp.]
MRKHGRIREETPPTNGIKGGQMADQRAQAASRRGVARRHQGHSNTYQGGARPNSCRLRLHAELHLALCRGGFSLSRNEDMGKDGGSGGGGVHALRAADEPAHRQLLLDVGTIRPPYRQEHRYGLYVGDPSGYDAPRRAGLEDGADDWHLLLQIDTDDNMATMWGDGGRVYFWIREEDLKSREFGNVWLILQCY